MQKLCLKFKISLCCKSFNNLIFFWQHLEEEEEDDEEEDDNDDDTDSHDDEDDEELDMEVTYERDSPVDVSIRLGSGSGHGVR